MLKEIYKTVILMALLKGVILALFASEVTLVQMIADDSFYYWLIAKNLILNGLSSFDGGQTSTSGYHLLWALLLSPVTIFEGSKGAEMKAFALFTSVFAIFGFVIAFAKIFKKRDREFLGVCAVLVTSYSWITNSTGGMEWSIVVLLQAVVFSLFLVKRQVNFGWLLTIGILGSMARTDFGLAIFILFLVKFIFQKHKMSAAVDELHNVSFLLLGSIIGILFTFIIFELVAGNWLQDSAVVKSMWADAHGSKPLSTIFQFLRGVLYIGDLTVHDISRIIKYDDYILLVTGTLFCAMLFIIGYGGDKKIQKILKILPESVAASFLIIVAYGLLYSIKVVEVQPWYTGNITIPLFIVFHWLVRLARIFLANKNVSVFPIHVLLIFLICTNMFGFLKQPFPHPAQVHMKQIGEYYAQKYTNEVVGFSGAGVVSFYQGGKTLNLDGLVNGQLLDYMPNNLPCFLKDYNVSVFDGFGASGKFFGVESPLAYSTIETTIYTDEFETTLYRLNSFKLACYDTDG